VGKNGILRATAVFSGTSQEQLAEIQGVVESALVGPLGVPYASGRRAPLDSVIPLGKENAIA